jgi:hypothetical protein
MEAKTDVGFLNRWIFPFDFTVFFVIYSGYDKLVRRTMAIKGEKI